MMRTLSDLRKDIDRVDEVLVRLLNERARCACEIGRLFERIIDEARRLERRVVHGEDLRPSEQGETNLKS